MTNSSSHLLIGFVLLLLGTSAGQAEAATRESPGLQLHWEPAQVPEQVIAEAAERGEELLSQIVELLGEEFRPKHRIPVYFHGPANSRKGDAPRVDMFGNIHLYQFGPDARSHLSPFAHELVHAIRNPHLTGRDGFLEEGFASYIALQLEAERPGFPFYGYPVHIVAGQWLGGEYELSLVDLARDHKRWNMACRIQSYSMRASFFEFLAQVKDSEHLIEFAKNSTDGSSPDYERWFGAELPVLVAQWRQDLWDRYQADPESAEMSSSYRSGPGQWVPPCDVAELVGDGEREEATTIRPEKQ